MNMLMNMKNKSVANLDIKSLYTNVPVDLTFRKLPSKKKH